VFACVHVRVCVHGACVRAWCVCVCACVHVRVCVHGACVRVCKCACMVHGTCVCVCV